jgi:hypothetical protein
MKWFCTLLLLLTLCFSQGDSELQEFLGGNIKGTLSFYSSMLYGIGANTANTNATLNNNGVESIFWNPAGLGYMTRGQFLVDIAPPNFINVPYYINELYDVDIQDKINKEIDDRFGDLNQGGIPYEYPQFSGQFKSGLRIQSIGLAVPVQKVAFGLAYYHGFEFNMDIIQTGLRVYARSEGETPLTTLSFRATTDTQGTFNMYSEVLAFSFAYRPLENLGFGITFEQYNLSAKARGYTNENAYLSLGSGEAVWFNDDSQNFHNTLYDTVSGNFLGKNFGIRFGTSFRPIETAEIAFTAHIPFMVAMKGPFFMVNNTPPFYENGKIDRDKIGYQEITRTKRVVYRSQGMDVRLPGNVKLGYAHDVGPVTLIANIAYTFNEFSIDFSNTEEDMDQGTVVMRHYRRGLETGMDLRLGFDFGPVKLGAGTIFARWFDETNYDQDEKLNLVIPVFSLAFGFPMGEHFRLDANLISVAMPISRVSLSYLF